MKEGQQEGQKMDSLFSGILSIVNISILAAGFHFIKVYWDREEGSMREYRRMTELEIRILNNKLEALGGNNHCA